MAKHPPVTHPVVRTHPVSGRKGLFVNEGFTTHINELKPRESDNLLTFLYAHIAQPEFTVRWRWAVDDIAFWDNRVDAALRHRGLPAGAADHAPRDSDRG